MTQVDVAPLAVPSNPSSTAHSGPIDTSTSEHLEDAYNGTSLTFQMLRACGWGSLLNLGYFQPWDWLLHPYRIDVAQKRLAHKSIALLDVQAGDRILDVACGRGYTSFAIAMEQPNATVVGLDYLEPHIDIAEFQYGGTPNLQYTPGNAEALNFEDASFTRLHCLEAAFHFDRAKFLAEAYRVLQPGGRLVLVDFMWTEPQNRSMMQTPEGKIIHDIWQFDDFWAISEYHAACQNVGFQITRQLDWSDAVTYALQRRSRTTVELGLRPFWNRLLCNNHSLFQRFSPTDWKNLDAEVAAHDALNINSRYIALVLDKPLTQ